MTRVIDVPRILNLFVEIYSFCNYFKWRNIVLLNNNVFDLYINHISEKCFFFEKKYFIDHKTDTSKVIPKGDPIEQGD